MSHQVTDLDRQAALRSLAHSKLTGRQDGAPASASAALGILYELASSPATATDALALLHELQVHQIELDLQAEELGGSRLELEAALHRQTQLYDFAPVGYFTVDDSMTLHELNLMGATLLGFERDELLGRALDSFLAPQSGHVLRGLFSRVRHGNTTERAVLSMLPRDARPRSVEARVRADPAGWNFLVALVDFAENP